MRLEDSNLGLRCKEEVMLGSLQLNAVHLVLFKVTDQSTYERIRMGTYVIKQLGTLLIFDHVHVPIVAK